VKRGLPFTSLRSSNNGIWHTQGGTFRAWAPHAHAACRRERYAPEASIPKGANLQTRTAALVLKGKAPRPARPRQRLLLKSLFPLPKSPLFSSRFFASFTDDFLSASGLKGKPVAEDRPGESAEDRQYSIDEQHLGSEAFECGETAFEQVDPRVAGAVAVDGLGHVLGELVGDLFDGGGEPLVAGVHLGPNRQAQWLDDQTLDGFELGCGELIGHSFGQRG